VSTIESPVLSVLLATPGRYATIRRTLDHLLAQSIRHQLEVVIVASSMETLQPDDTELSRFHSYQVVELGSIRSVGSANAAGVRHARAPIVVLAEDHCFPDPDWAERLVSAHQGPWAAVGPGVRNANPGTAVSWADLLIGYGPWLIPAPAREATFLPGHNSSYTREVLLGYGDRLDSMMEAETVLHWDLREKGHRLYMESGARVAHTNFSLWSSWLPAQYYNGRVFAGTRASGKAWPWRVLFTLGAPAIPVVRLCRIWAGLSSSDLRLRFVRCLHALTVGLAVDGLGQMAGYALGAGSARERVARYEVDRFRHVREQDRLDILGA